MVNRYLYIWLEMNGTLFHEKLANLEYVFDKIKKEFIKWEDKIKNNIFYISETENSSL